MTAKDRVEIDRNLAGYVFTGVSARLYCRTKKYVTRLGLLDGAGDSTNSIIIEEIAKS